MIRLHTGISRVLSTALVTAVALAVIVGGAAAVRASKSDLVTVASEKQKEDPTLILTRGMAEIVTVDGPVSDIMVANPSIVDVSALQSNRLYVVGTNYGTTNVIALDAEGNVISRLNVHVKIDDVALKDTVKKLFPDEDVQIVSKADQVIISGEVSSSDVADRVAKIVSSYISGGAGGAVDNSITNMLTVAGEQQVMLRVKIIEASRDVLRELGIETDVPDYSKASLGGAFSTDASVLGLTTDPLGLATVFYDTGTALGTMNFTIRALETDGLVNTLAEPNLTAISGEQAGFLAGGEYPVPTSRDQNGNVIIEYRPFGVALNFKPVVLSNDRISLQLQTEVSSVSNQNSINVNGLNIPGFSVRRASTTVELGSGGSLMIAGLLQSDVAKSMSDLPGIKNIPILGALVSSDSFQRQESELLVIVTAYTVKPYADQKNQANVVPEYHANPLASAFADNIRDTYAKLSLSPDLFNQDGRYGYLIE